MLLETSVSHTIVIRDHNSFDHACNNLSVVQASAFHQFLYVGWRLVVLIRKIDVAPWSPAIEVRFCYINCTQSGKTVALLEEHRSRDRWAMSYKILKDGADHWRDCCYCTQYKDASKTFPYTYSGWLINHPVATLLRQIAAV